MPTMSPKRGIWLTMKRQEIAAHSSEWLTGFGLAAGLNLLWGWFDGYPWFTVFGSEYSTLFWVIFVLGVLKHESAEFLLRQTANKTDAELAASEHDWPK